MKRFLILLVCVFGLQTLVKADNEKLIQISQLPATAQQFIQNHFAGSTVAVAKMNDDYFDKSYDVIFSNGDKVEFDKKGEWTEIKSKTGTVPAGAVPAPIQKQVSEKYPDARIIGIERDRRQYEVQLSSGWELTFDKNFNLVDIDD